MYARSRSFIPSVHTFYFFLCTFRMAFFFPLPLLFPPTAPPNPPAFRPFPFTPVCLCPVIPPTAGLLESFARLAAAGFAVWRIGSQADFATTRRCLPKPSWLSSSWTSNGFLPCRRMDAFRSCKTKQPPSGLPDGGCFVKSHQERACDGRGGETGAA